MRSSTIVASVLCCAVVGALAFAQDTKNSKQTSKSSPPAATAPAAAPASATQGGLPEGFQLPPGVTAEQFAECMATANPGEMHEWLCADAGTWNGKATSWWFPGAEANHSDCTFTVTPMMGGRFVQSHLTADWPGMGPFEGFSITGYDNVGGQFQSTWVDSCGTGMMVGTGELSSDKTSLTFNYTFNCPLQKKPVNFRETLTRTGPNSHTMVMWGPAPDTGKEFKMMEISYTRAASTTTQASAR